MSAGTRNTNIILTVDIVINSSITHYFTDIFRQIDYFKKSFITNKE